MANGFDIGINFVEDPNDKNSESKDKPTEPKVKGKSKTSKTTLELTQEQLSRMRDIEARYQTGKLKGPEVEEYLKLAKVQIGSGLKDLLSKGTTWVGGKEVLRGKPLSRVEERRGHPNEQKNRLKEQMTKAITKAMEKTSNLRSEIIGPEPTTVGQSISMIKSITEKIETANPDNALDPSTSTTVPSPTTSKSVVSTPKSYSSKSASSTYKTKLSPYYSASNLGKIYGFGFGTEDLPDPKTVSREQWLEAYMPLMLKGLPNVEIDHEDLVNLESMFGNKNPFSPDSPLMKMMGKWAYGSDLHETNWLDGIRELFADKSKATKMMLEQISKESGVALDLEEFSDPSTEDYKSLAKAFTKYLPKYLSGKESNRNISNLLETSKAVIDPLEYSIKTWENARKNKATQVVKPTAMSVASSMIPPSKKSVSTKSKDLFDYSSEQNTQNFEASKKKDKELAKKLVNDAIAPITESIDALQKDVDKLATGGGGSKPPKPPKAPPGDDGMGDGEDFNPEGYDPFPTLRARVENLTDTFKSTLYGERESTFFSSLQKIYEESRRTENVEDVEKQIDKEVRNQTKLLKAFKTRNENTRNMLEAALIERLRKENARPDDAEGVMERRAWLETKLEEVKNARDEIEREYENIEKDINKRLHERASEGFAAGKIERDIRDMETMSKEEDKLLKQYTRDFGKYVKAAYKEIATERAFNIGSEYIEKNKDKLRSSELLKKAKLEFDKEFERVMESMPTETEATRQEIIAAYNPKTGQFDPKSFRPIRANAEYVARQQSSGGGSGGAGQPPTSGSTSAASPDDIPPSKQNLSQFILPPNVDMDKVRQNFARYALIQQVTKPMVQASTPGGVKGSEVFGSAASVGAGALALGVISGPLAIMAVGVTQTVGILTQIAENTAKEVTPFSPELIMSKVDQSLTRLNINMAIAANSGKELANYQRSSNALSNELYGIGNDIWDSLDFLVVFIVDVLTIVVGGIRLTTIMLSIVFNLLELVLWPLLKAVDQIRWSVSWVTSWLTGVKDAKIKDYTEEFMGNDLRNPKNNNRL